MKRYTHYPLAGHNTFGIAARCTRFWEYASIDELRLCLGDLRQWPDAPLLHIGGGSNLLFTKDFDGTILHSAITGIEAQEHSDGSVSVRVGAAEEWDAFVAHCVAHGRYGLENLSLIPGEAGASAVQNIGAYGAEAGDFIEIVETVELGTGRVRVFTHDECGYAYRSSVFKTVLRGCYAVTHVTFRLSTTFRPDVTYGGLAREIAARGIAPATLSAADLRQLVIDIRRKKLPDPSEIGSAGSFFINPVVSESLFEQLRTHYPDIPHYVVENGVKIPAGWLIEQCGWKGRRMGDAGVYDRQALVLVNYGKATGQDIVRLSDAVRSDVAQKFGIDIRPEVNFI